MEGRTKSVTLVPWPKFKSSFLCVERRTKPPTCALVQNLSPSTYGWKDEPSHSRVPWSKFKSSYLRVGGRTKSLTNALIQNLKSYYLRMEGRTKPPASALVQILSPSTYKWKDEPSHLRVPWSKIEVLLPTGGMTNQATSK